MIPEQTIELWVHNIGMHETHDMQDYKTEVKIWLQNKGYATLAGKKIEYIYGRK